MEMMKAIKEWIKGSGQIYELQTQLRKEKEIHNIDLDKWLQQTAELYATLQEKNDEIKRLNKRLYDLTHENLCLIYFLEKENEELRELLVIKNSVDE